METADSGKDVIDVAAYMDRDRGAVAYEYSFVVFKGARGINWYGEPLNKCAFNSRQRRVVRRTTNKEKIRC